MTDNIFDRLLELLQSPGPVNWALAGEVAASLSGKPEPIDGRLVEEYRELARTAGMHLSRISSLEPPHTEARPLDRAGWAEANLQSFRYLVDPLADKLAQAPSAGPLDAIVRPLGPALLGMQSGTMVGFMSHRALGRFDVGLPVLGEPEPQPIVPNVEAFTRDHELDPPQARLWVALHEVVHAAQLGIPWVASHFAELIRRYFDGIEFDPGAIATQLESIEDPAQIERLMQEPGALVGVVAGPEQQQHLEAIQAFLAFMEGFGDFLMDRLAPGLVPEAPRIREALIRRRAEPTQGEQLIQQLVGLSLDRKLYRAGAAFCDEVTRRWGEGELDRIWEGPDLLPTLAELEDPVGWAARLL